MLRFIKVVVAFCIGLASVFGAAGASRAQQNPITAIDIALEPDATMIQHAQADNARLLKALPEGVCSGCNAPPSYLNVAAVCPHG